MSWTAWVILGAVGAFVLLVVVLAVLERNRGEQEPQRDEGDEP